MSREVFNDNCPGCKPVALDTDTLKPLPSDSPIMRAIEEVWKDTTVFEREAFHRFTCLNSREPGVLLIIESITKRIEQTVKDKEQS